MTNSGSNFSSAFDNLMEGCQIIGFDWRYLYLNPAAVSQSRLNKEDLLGKKYTDVWLGSDNTNLYKIMRRCLDDRVAHRFENEFVYPDGTVGWFDLRIQPLPEGIFVLSIDITERKKVEKELRESEEKYRLISENSDDWIYWINSTGNLQYVSPSCERVTGYSPYEFINDRQLIFKIAFPDDKESVGNHFLDPSKERKPDKLDFRIITKTGEVRWISHSCSPIYNQEGKYIGRRGTNRNITDHKQAKDVLERQHALLLALINSPNDTIIFSLDQNYCYTTFNEAHRLEMKRIWNVDIEIGMNLLDYMQVPELQVLAKKSIDRALSGESFSEIQHQPEPSIYYEFSWNPVFKLTQVVGITVFIRNITKNKHAEDLLHESEEEFRGLFCNAMNGVAVHQIVQDENGKPVDYIFLKANASFEAQTGLKVADIIGKRVTEVIPGIEKSSLIAIYGKVALTGVPISMEQFIEPLDKYFHINVYQLVHGRFVTVFQNITERKQTEEALRVSEEKFRNVFEQSVVGKSMTNLDGTLKVNLAFSRILGYSETELSQRIWQSITHPDDIDNDQTIISSLISGEREFARWEKRYIHKNGNIVWVDISTTLQRDNSDKPLFFNTSIIDITDRKVAEEQIRILSKELEQKVVERTIELQRNKMFLEETGRLARVGGWEIDLVNGKNYWTETTKFIHEVEPDFDPNLNAALTFYAPESVPKISACVDKLISLGEPFDEELELITAKKNRIWVRAIGQAYRADGKIVKIGGAIQDINEHIIAEHELAILAKQLEQRSTLLEESNKELEAFSYSVSHDLRAPLRQINGFVDLLNERFYDSLGEKGKHYLECISKSATQMGTLIDDLLQFSRTGRQEMRHHPLDMEKLVDEVLAQIKPTAEGRLVEWNIAKLPQVEGDYSLLSLVWYNLLDNALKFTSRKGKTIVETGFTENDAEFQFFVRDNGVGFDMQYAHKLFGVFQRLHSTGEFEGTGIGLANVQRIVLKHGGRVWAEAKPDKGAVFYFTLPKTNTP